MKKAKKVKISKSSPKKSAAPDVELPNIVTGMAKLVERLEILERKMDQVLGRVSNLPAEMRNAVQSSRPQPSHTPQSFQQKSEQYSSGYSHGQEPAHRNERKMFQAVCADCHKNCEVPFKPGDRPVYCKECFAIRKAGHKPQDPDRRSAIQHLQKKTFKPEPMDYTPPPAPRGATAVLKAKPKKRKR
jgi:CxxC-x17-CxxC domain-containing protein